ncbi:CYTH domain-containing protein [Litchfieldella xinjiangensis]|uniref:CYTH domain-containing protein n=1 Tax=Litchfieldella xinjiangensis TaxID=1166948 RepID=UPI0005BCD01B|nr:CYTH domain-containing protein [Halomonas xinjiangensis]
MSQEIELKLALADDAASRLFAHPLLEGAPSSVYPLRNTYYDTPEATLEAARVALRIRRTPTGLLQTLKTSGQGQGGLSVRGEWEWPIENETLDLVGLAKLPPMRDLSADTLASLIPRFTTDFERHAWHVETDDGSVEVALDRGEIRAAGRRVPIAELELELKGGKPQALWLLASRLAEQVPLRPASTSKAARSAALLAGSWPLPNDPNTPAAWLERAIAALDAYHDSRDEAFKTSARESLATMAARDTDDDTQRLAARLAERLEGTSWFDVDFGRDALTLAQRLTTPGP